MVRENYSFEIQLRYTCATALPCLSGVSVMIIHLSSYIGGREITKHLGVVAVREGLISLGSRWI